MLLVAHEMLVKLLTKEPIMTDASYEAQADQFLQALMREYYEVFAGLKPELRLAPIYERHADLFAVETVQVLLDSRSDKAGRHLAAFATEGYISNQTKELD